MNFRADFFFSPQETNFLPQSSPLYRLLKKQNPLRGFIGVTANFRGEENPAAVFDEHDDPRIFPTVCTDNRAGWGEWWWWWGGCHSPLICCSNGKHPGHNASSAFDNRRRWKSCSLPLSSLSTSPFLQRMPSVHSNSRIRTQLTNLINGPYTLSQCRQ